jgi:hypothetical protein
MTRDDIIRMAREAGMHEGWDGWTTGDDPNCLYPECVYTENLERFAALVAAAEREACTKVCERMWHEWLDSPEENEPNKPDAEDCYKAIRARGQA